MKLLCTGIVTVGLGIIVMLGIFTVVAGSLAQSFAVVDLVAVTVRILILLETRLALIVTYALKVKV